MRERGLEPPRPCERYHLKVVRLPVSPPAQVSKHQCDALALYTNALFFQVGRRIQLITKGSPNGTCAFERTVRSATARVRANFQQKIMRVLSKAHVPFGRKRVNKKAPKWRLFLTLLFLQQLLPLLHLHQLSSRALVSSCDEHHEPPFLVRSRALNGEREHVLQFQFYQ